MQDNYVNMQVTNPFKESDFYMGKSISNADICRHRCKMQHYSGNMRDTLNYVYMQIICYNMLDNLYVEINILRVNIINLHVDIFDRIITRTQGSELCQHRYLLSLKTFLISMQFFCNIMWT